MQLKGGWSTWTKRRRRSIDRPASWRGCSLWSCTNRVHIVVTCHDEREDRNAVRIGTRRGIEGGRGRKQQATLRRRHGKSICRRPPPRYNHPTKCNDLQTGKILQCEVSFVSRGRNRMWELRQEKGREGDEMTKRRKSLAPTKKIAAASRGVPMSTTFATFFFILLPASVFRGTILNLQPSLLFWWKGTVLSHQVDALHAVYCFIKTNERSYNDISLY